MRILHTADWHLGKTLCGASFHGMQEWFLGVALPALLAEVRPDVLVVAGDVYDRAIPPADSTALLSDALDRAVRRHGVRVILTAGNHDDAQRLAFAASLLGDTGLHIVECPLGRVITLADAHGDVAFCCAGFGTPALLTEKLDLATRLPDHDAAFAAGVAHLLAQVPGGTRRLYVGHAFVQGGTGCESERPVQLGGGGLVAAAHLDPFHHAMLGHLHRAQAHGRAAYSGSPLAYSFGEAGQRKSLSLVEIGADGSVRREEVPLDPPALLRCVRGTAAEILDLGLPKGDWLDVTLTERDSTAIHRLREHLPHILQYRFEPLGLAEAEAAAPARRRGLAGDPLELLEEFWTLLGEGEWGDAQRDAARAALEGVG